MPNQPFHAPGLPNPPDADTLPHQKSEFDSFDSDESDFADKAAHELGNNK